MPIANAYVSSEGQRTHLLSHVAKLQWLISQELSCDDRQLMADEVSVRVLVVPREGRLADVEIDIAAAPYEERVKRQDNICFNIAGFLQDRLGTDVKAWLVLSELGHSVL